MKKVVIKRKIEKIMTRVEVLEKGIGIFYENKEEMRG